MTPRTSRRRLCIVFVAAVRCVVLCCLVRFAVFSGPLHAQGTVSEYDVKAAFIAKFPEFVKWPAGAGSITVGLLGDDSFGGALDRMVKVKRSKRVEDLKGCQIIFVSKSERGNVGGILAALSGANVLTVGESDGFTRQGGAIGFTMEGDKVRFEINTRAAQRSGLEISARLLKLATRVVGS